MADKMTGNLQDEGRDWIYSVI